MSDHTTMSPAEVVLELIRRACAREFAGMFDLCHEDVVLSLPTFLPRPVVIEGLDKITAFNNAKSGPTTERKPPRLYANLEARNFRVYQSTDPNVVIVAWDFVSHIDGHEVVHPNIQVTHCRDGKMVHTTDYHTMVMRAVANGEVPKYLDMIESMILPEDRSGSKLPRSPVRRQVLATTDSSTTSPAAGIVLEQLRRRSRGDVLGALQLCADDIEITVPFMLPKPLVIKGKATLTEMFERTATAGRANLPRQYDDLEIRDVRVHETTDPNVVVIEWTNVSRIGESTVIDPNIAVSECRDGKIVRTTHYYDPVFRAVANGEIPACLETIKNMILPGDRAR